MPRLALLAALLLAASPALADCIGNGIAVSGFGQPDDKKRALEAGFDDHITKPADVQDIEDLMARYPMGE
jgi:CheY-like chemotaxis protein